MNKLLIQNIDKDNMFDVLINFHNQIKDALEVSGKYDLSKFDKSGLQNIIITGLGGSAIGGDLI